MGSMAPELRVVVPSGQAVQEAGEAPPVWPLYRPMLHAMHTCDPGSAEKVPVGHAWHCVAPGLAAAVPGGQGAQAEEATAPSALLALPTGQEMHPSRVCPGAGL